MIEKADRAESEMRKEEEVDSEEDEDDDDDDEEDEDDEDIISCDTSDSDGRKKKERPLWDKFADIPHEEESISMADTTLIDISISVLKLMAYLITFCVVLFAAVFSKLILLLMTSQLTPNKTVTVRRGSLWLNLELDTMERYLWIWSLMVVYAAPEVGTFIRSVRYVLFKGHINREMKNGESRKIFLVTLAMETFHVIGMALLAFEILPHIDVIKGVMLTNCVCLIPGILSSFSYDGKDKLKWKKVVPDTVAILLQLTGYVLWPTLDGRANLRLWFIPVTLLLVSCGWWMNFVLDKSKFGIIRLLGEIKDCLKENHVILYRHYIWISLLKIATFAVATFGILSLQGENLSDFFGSIKQTFNPNRTMVAFQYEAIEGSLFYFEVSKKESYIQTVGINVWQIIGAQILAAYICYGFSKFACKIQISSFSFALPVVLVVPVTIECIIIMTAYRNEDPNVFNGIMPNYLFFNNPSVCSSEEIFINQDGWVWILWLISQTWITLHIWHPKCERLSRTEKLFATPMYSGFLVDQSVALNRRRDKLETKSNNFSTPHIITCATMWHETKPEMLKMLKSIMRMDQDQCLRESAKENLKSYDEETNYYTYESHIFFDDAFEIEEKTKNFVINSFVRDLIGSMNKAVEMVYASKSIRIEPPQKMATPYGGRLTYILPGQTVLHVHLKDKDKIRHRKRWSQVMYMYYLLGYNLMEKEELSHEEKLSKAENVFILALDGDIDFKPQAVILLVDLMKKNSNLGAACGRIHPVGSGIMVWYQSFEYAIGHWLQKATEHVIGCVLCSPGCFSLFRGRALMADNVMKKYTTKAEEARHYVQYDQGEDRWLCTLLLQRGYRVEYSAASDAYTQCPESFNEFYTQRRRWIPSTMANILELLYNYKQTIIINNDISLMYIVYQTTLMIGTVLGPGTIFLLLVSAFNAAFKIDNFTSLYYNMIPILLYVVVCLFMSEKVQLASGLLLSGIYGLIMMAVLVGMMMQISDDGLLAPSTIFLFIVAGEIIIAGILHPQEMYCLIHGPIYFITIPSMYLLLIIYSVCNLNVVTWGTREVKQKKTEEEVEQEKKAAAEAKKQGSLQSILGSFGSKNKSKTENEGAIEFSFANLFKCMFCTHPKSDHGGKDWAKVNESLSTITKKLENIERCLDYNSTGYNSSLGKVIQRSESKSSIHQGDVSSSESDAPKAPKTDAAPKKEDATIAKEDRDDLLNPYWIEDDSLKKSDLVMLNSNEMTFWKELISEYLYPLIKDKEKENEISKALKELRDRMVLTFFMLNALFIITVFLLQMNKSKIFLDWPLDARINITITDNKEIQIKKTYLQLEPIGVLFILFFAIILVVQFIAMLFHRFETLCHLLSSSPIILPWKKKKPTFDMKVKVGKKQLLMNEIENKNEISDTLTLDEPPRDKIDIKEMTNSIFSRMKHKEDLEMAEKAEKRRTSAFAWAQNKIEALGALRPLEYNKNKLSSKLEQLVERAEV